MWAFWDKIHQISSANKILPVSFFEGAIFK